MGAHALFPFEWRVACCRLEFLDKVVRGAETGSGGNLVDVEVGFQQKPFCFGEAVRKDDLSERSSKAGGTCLVETRARFVEGVGDLLSAKRMV